ncbi:MAG: AraC family transcriptional regulator, partial [Clostridiales bacterium]|nr:AraC family transcriptional regulator [Clostridiales bacterium]
ILFAGFGLFLAVLLSLLLSRWLYLPIRAVTRRFQTSKLPPVVSKKDEIEMIDYMYEQSQERISELEQRQSLYAAHEKITFLQAILSGKLKPDEALRKWGDFSIRVYPSRLLVAVMTLDDESASGDRLIACIDEWAVGMSDSQVMFEAIPAPDGGVILIFNLCEPYQENRFSSLFINLDMLKTCVLQKFGSTVTIGVGAVAESLEDCAFSLSTARQMAQHRMLLGDGRTIDQRLLDESLSTGLAYPEDLVREMTAAMRENKRAVFLSHFDSLLGILRNYSYNDVTATLIQVFADCVRALNALPQRHGLIYSGFDDFMLGYHSLVHLEQTKEWILKIFDEYQTAAASLEALKQDRHYKIVCEIQDYFEKNYARPDLNVQTLAAMTGYTPNYFARIFKQITGLSLIDYIHQIRINHAKRLLCETSMTIREISDNLGFLNPNYFYVSFKKETGLTPTVFRARSLSTVIRE